MIHSFAIMVFLIAGLYFFIKPAKEDEPDKKETSRLISVIVTTLILIFIVCTYTEKFYRPEAPPPYIDWGYIISTIGIIFLSIFAQRIKQ